MSDKKESVINSSWKILPKPAKVIIILLVLIASVIATVKIIKAVKDYLNKPHNVPPPDDLHTPSASFDAGAIADALHNDIYAGWFTPRNRQIYSTLSSLSDTEFVMVYNKWNDKYYKDDQESLATAIAGEKGVDGQFYQQKNDLAIRFSRLNLS